MDALPSLSLSTLLACPFFFFFCCLCFVGMANRAPSVGPSFVAALRSPDTVCLVSGGPCLSLSTLASLPSYSHIPQYLLRFQLSPMSFRSRFPRRGVVYYMYPSPCSGHRCAHEEQGSRMRPEKEMGFPYRD
ncbi:hypothetical protein C8R46DRAFT_277169 [Mycena filopes]|nr:hypothetical protein C8R46DRAFT_277169 [Mycena filopes]